MAERSTDLRTRIVRAAAELLTQGGREAVSTRAVSAAAGVQAPAIYRQFGDMNALLHAAAREVFAGYIQQKVRRTPASDPVDELRHGWDVHVAFGLANPAAYTLMYASTADVAAGSDGSDERDERDDGTAGAAEAPELRDGYAMLEALVTRIAQAGRLRVSIPHATWLIRAGASGVTLSLLSSPPDERDARLSDAMRDMVLDAIIGARVSKATRGPGPGRVASRAVALRAVLDEAEVLSTGEQLLLAEWLDRLAAPG